MNKHLLLILLGFGLIGCAGLTYEDAQSHFTTRADIELCLYIVGEKNDAYTNSPTGMYAAREEFNARSLNKERCDEIRSRAALTYKKMQIESNERYRQKEQEEKKRLQKLEAAKAKAYKKQYDDLLNNKREICKSYGYTKSEEIAKCIEREVNIDRQRIAAQTQQQNKLNQQNFQRQQQALSDLANIFNDMGRGTYGEQKQEEPQKVCVYKCGFDTVTTTDFICPIEISYKGQSCFLD